MMKVNILIIINYIVILLVFLENFTRDKNYVDFGFIGILFIGVEIFIIIFYIIMKNKSLLQNILFIGSLLLSFLYLR